MFNVFLLIESRNLTKKKIFFIERGLSEKLLFLEMITFTGEFFFVSTSNERLKVEGGRRSVDCFPGGGNIPE